MGAVSRRSDRVSWRLDGLSRQLVRLSRAMVSLPFSVLGRSIGPPFELNDGLDFPGVIEEWSVEEFGGEDGQGRWKLARSLSPELAFPEFGGHSHYENRPHVHRRRMG
jgi:hypothetical protein